jgi:hypothetical protein
LRRAGPIRSARDADAQFRNNGCHHGDRNCAPGSVPILIPDNGQCGNGVRRGTWYISSVGLDTFTITHVNSATATDILLCHPRLIWSASIQSDVHQIWPQAKDLIRAAIERTG